MIEETNNIKTVTDIDENLINLTDKDKVETVVKNLLNKKNVDFISELTFIQVVEICKLKHIAKKYGKNNFPKLNALYPIEDNIDYFINNFMLYMCSHKRKRVQEFLDGLKSERTEKMKTPSFFSKIMK
jgi:hypothetical protein